MEEIMTANTLRMKLQIGSRKVSAEGSRADVEAMIEKWWPSLISQEIEENESEQKTSSKRTSSTKRLSRPKAPSSKPSDEAGSFDVNALANLIKEHESSEAIVEKIINAKGDYFHKVALVLWVADEPLTSGQIHKVLEALDVKIDLPSVSKALKNNSANFITSSQRKAGGKPSDYRLTAKAKVEFESWLNTPAK
jgi:hypothetical protein